MATIAQMLTARATAGSDYATALADLRTKWIALRKYDLALSNENVHRLAANPASLVPVPTFPNAGTWDASCLRHPIYATSGTMVQQEWEAEAVAAALTLITSASA